MWLGFVASVRHAAGESTFGEVEEEGVDGGGADEFVESWYVLRCVCTKQGGCGGLWPLFEISPFPDDYSLYFSQSGCSSNVRSAQKTALKELDVSGRVYVWRFYRGCWGRGGLKGSRGGLGSEWVG